MATVFLAGLTARGAPPKVTKNKSPGNAWEVSLLLIKDKSVHNKKRERASCQAKKLGGIFFFYLILCAQFPASLKKSYFTAHPYCVI